jgi:hypothetical protein
VQGVLSKVSGPVIEARFPARGSDGLPKIGELLHVHNNRVEAEHGEYRRDGEAGAGHQRAAVLREQRLAEAGVEVGAERGARLLHARILLAAVERAPEHVDDPPAQLLANRDRERAPAPGEDHTQHEPEGVGGGGRPDPIVGHVGDGHERDHHAAGVFVGE